MGGICDIGGDDCWGDFLINSRIPLKYGVKPVKIEELLQRKGIINRDPEIMSGVPVFVGTRVPLKTFFDYLEGESGFAEFINDFPYLESQAIKVLENLTKMMLSLESDSNAYIA